MGQAPKSVTLCCDRDFSFRPNSSATWPTLNCRVLICWLGFPPGKLYEDIRGVNGSLLLSLSLSLSLSRSLALSLSLSVCLSVCMCVCLYVCVYKENAYTHTHIYIYMYTYRVITEHGRAVLGET